jgi:hypothetical protein
MRTQVQALGGLSPRAQSQLQRAAEAKHAGVITPPPRIKPGTKLIRAWQNKTHTVSVLHEGFEWQGSRYRSLSEVVEQDFNALQAQREACEAFRLMTFSVTAWQRQPTSARGMKRNLVAPLYAAR